MISNETKQSYFHVNNSINFDDVTVETDQTVNNVENYLSKSDFNEER